MSCTRALCNAQRGGYTRVVDQSGSAVNLPADANVYRAKLEAGKVARFWPHPAIIRRAICSENAPNSTISCALRRRRPQGPFSCNGVSPAHDDSTNILHFSARVLVIAGGKEPRSD